MGKLFNLKEWLTVADAARHLSIVFGEEVTEADVLRLALDGHLKLSVYFVNHAYARCGKIIRYTEAELKAAYDSGNFPKALKLSILSPKSESLFFPGIPDSEKGQPRLGSLWIDDDRYLTLADEVTTIAGVWDLPMIGSEESDIEHKYQNLTNGPYVTLQSLEGAFVEGKDGKVCQLQTDFDDNKYQSGSTASLKNIKKHISENNIGKIKAERLLNQHKEARKDFLASCAANRASKRNSENYFPADGLPKDSVLVVRTEALRQLEQSISGASKNVDRPIKTRERRTLLTIIAALCKKAGIDCSARGAAQIIMETTVAVGARVTDDTILKMLGEIPDALETRSGDSDDWSES